jgi:hypothetical protein
MLYGGIFGDWSYSNVAVYRAVLLRGLLFGLDISKSGFGYFID